MDRACLPAEMPFGHAALVKKPALGLVFFLPVARVCQGASALWFLLSPPTRKIRPFRPCDKIAGYEKLLVPLVIL